jgi:hypothetical protein
VSGYRRGSRSVNTSNPWGGRMTVLIGGRDAPMGPADQHLFKIIVGIVVVIAAGLLLFTLLD